MTFCGTSCSSGTAGLSDSWRSFGWRSRGRLRATRSSADLTTPSPLSLSLGTRSNRIPTLSHRTPTGAFMELTGRLAQASRTTRIDRSPRSPRPRRTSRTRDEVPRLHSPSNSTPLFPPMAVAMERAFAVLISTFPRLQPLAFLCSRLSTKSLAQHHQSIQKVDRLFYCLN